MLADLLEYIAKGIEYPDALWLATGRGMRMESARLQDLYDNHGERNETL